MVNYKDDPKVKVIEITEEEIKQDGDSWCSLIEFDGKYAVDINYFECGEEYGDEGEDEQYCYFYGCFPDKDGDIIIDCDCDSEESYDIDFSDPEWKDKLYQAAYEFLIDEVLPYNWNSCCEYAAFHCAEFSNVIWKPYTMYDGRKGIDLHSLDDLGNIYDTVSCGVCDSFKVFKESFWRNMGLLNRKGVVN